MISINVVRAFCFTIALLVSNCAADAYDKVDATNTPGRETVNASVQSADY